jgi:ferredoxin
MTRRRLAVDWPACKAHGVCAELLPEIVQLDEWGYPVLAPGPVPASLRRYAQRAVSSCPALALRLVPFEEPAADPVVGLGEAPAVDDVGPRRRARRSS